MSIDELIEALETATGPSRELDARITVCCRVPFHGAEPRLFDNFPVWRVVKHASEGCRVECVHDNGISSGVWKPQHWTGSLDAALRLVPDGRLWSVGTIINGSGYCAVLSNDGQSHRGATPAIAICIAAMKARKALADA